MASYMSYFDSPQYKNSPAGRGAPLQRTPGFNTPFGAPGSNFGSGAAPFSGFSQPFSGFGGGFAGGFGGGFGANGSGMGLYSSDPLGFDTASNVMPDPFKGPPVQQSGNIAGRIIDWAKGNPKDALGMAGNVAGAVMQYQQMQKQNRLAEREAKLREEEIARRRRNEESMSPARAQVLQMLLGNLKG